MLPLSASPVLLAGMCRALMTARFARPASGPLLVQPSARVVWLVITLQVLVQQLSTLVLLARRAHFRQLEPVCVRGALRVVMRMQQP